MFSDADIDLLKDRLQGGVLTVDHINLLIVCLIEEMLAERNHLRKTIVRQEQALANAYRTIEEMGNAQQLP